MPAPATRSAVRRAGSALLVGFLVFAGFVGVVNGTASPAHAAPEKILPESEISAHWSAQDGNTGDVPVPSCNSKNITGGDKSAWWLVKSSLGSGSVIYPGREWTVYARIMSDWSHGVGNNGPSPLMLQVPPTGPVAEVGFAEGGISNYQGHYYKGQDWVGARHAILWGYNFDSDSNPIFAGSDGAHVWTEITMKATGPGIITLPEFKVWGHDATPKAADFACAMKVGFSWTVVEPEKPTSGKDLAHVDSSYVHKVAGDANGGNHSVAIDVLANDDDPNAPGGPGDHKQVRIAAWDTKSAKGGGVTCGTNNGATDFAKMSTQPCVYQPPKDANIGDSFTYVLRSVTGYERTVTVNVALRRNNPPFASETTFGAVSNTPDTFDLKAFDLDGDPVTCSLQSPANGGKVTVHDDCTIDWTPNPAFTGTADFVVRACDTHPTLVNGQLGTGVTRTIAYHLPNDLSETTSRRCSHLPAHIYVNTGAVIPAVGVPDTDVVDAGYAGSGVGPYSVEIPVLENDYDNNGPDPADPSSKVTVQIADAPPPLQGTAEVTADRRIRFTPVNAFSGTAEFTYRLCEDPLQQKPPYVDNPLTPYINEGLPVCGLGKVAVDVRGNHQPMTAPDEVTTASTDEVVDFDVAANDVEPDGENLACLPGELKVEPQGIIASATIDGDCKADIVPVADAGGVATVHYTVCDDHHLTHPKHPAVPYGADGRSPGDLAPRCWGGELKVTSQLPYVPGPSEWDLDPEPVCIDDVATTAMDTPVQVSVLANDSDVSAKGHPSPLELVGASFEKQEGEVDKPENATDQGGTVAVGDGGVIVYTPPAGFSGIDSFVYSAQDTIGHGCGAKVTVTVLGPDGGVPGGDPNSGSGSGGGHPGGGNPTSGNPGGGNDTDVAGSHDTAVDRAGHGAPGHAGRGGAGSLPRTGLELLTQVASGFALLSGGGTVWALTRRRRQD